MSNWKRLYYERKWDDLWDWMRDDVEREDLVALYEQLKQDIRPIMRENGTEQLQELPRPDEVAPEWQGAAEILQERYLEWLIQDAPPAEPDNDGVDATASNAWTAEVLRVRAALNTLRESPEPTKGDGSLSRNAHIDAFDDAIKQLSFITSVASSEVAMDGGDQHDIDWLKEVIAEVASQAFLAGIHAQIAHGKIIEVHAISGQKSSSGAHLGGKMTKAAMEAKAAPIFAEMQRHIRAGHSMANAARLAHQNDYGTSPDANRERWKRYQRRKKVGTGPAPVPT